MIRFIGQFLQWFLLLGITVLALNRYSPLLLTFHAWSLLVVIALTLLIIGLQRRINGLSVSAALVLSMALLLEGRFYYQRYVVLTSDPDIQRLLGAHVVVGYQDLAELDPLLERQLVGGVFLTKRNIQQISLADLQALTGQLRRPTLRWLATDQEGGLVQRLSPPLPHHPPLREVIAEAEQQWPQAVQAYAQQQGHSLASVGVNLNFAPVVDLPQQATFWDTRSYISARVLADDATTITAAGKIYSAGLLATGVLPSLKHFPGLGRITTDTHFFTATLETDLATLQAEDWQPFREITQALPVAMMLAHVKLSKVDNRYPVSFSPAAIRLLRDNWGYEGVLITDDFSMFPVYYSGLGSGQAAVQALNSGVDLILLAYDNRLYYPVMYALLRAYAQGQLDVTQLAASQARQQRALAVLQQ